MKKILCCLTAIIMTLSLAACDSIPLPGFEEYDVSGHIGAILESSYYQNSTKIMEITSETPEAAAEYYSVTVRNATTRFCNTFGINPAADQMAELETVIGEAYRLAKYTVQPEVKVSTGYTIDVEITPLTNIRDSAGEFEEATQRIAEKYNQQAIASATNDDGQANRESDTDEYADNGEEDYDGDASSDNFEEPIEPPPIDTDAMNREIIAEMIQLIRNSLLVPSYGEMTTVTLDILLEDNGDILLDTVQMDRIDETVLTIAKG